MKNIRSLTLKREALADLTPGDLSAVIGGASLNTACTLDLLEESRMACSFNCQWTFNTCEC